MPGTQRSNGTTARSEGSLISMDPGVTTCAAVRWVGGRLTLAALYVRPAGLARRGSLLASELLSRVAQEASQYLVRNMPRAEALVVERMQIYPGKTKNTQPNDLLDVQAVGALVAGRLSDDVVWVHPNEWKGTVPKRIDHARSEKSLSPEELTKLRACLRPYALGLHEHIWDAVGIGLDYLRRRG